MITLREKKGEGRLLHILMGRARTGKSERVLQRIAALGDSSQQILLVPEHASHVAEMDLCRVCGDTASRHAEALTFKLLASRVLGICGGSADVTLDSGGKLLTLQRTLTELAPVLKVYKRPSQRAAFLESLLAVMEELQAYAVSPEQLSESVAQIEGDPEETGRALREQYRHFSSTAFTSASSTHRGTTRAMCLKSWRKTSKRRDILAIKTFSSTVFRILRGVSCAFCVSCCGARRA